MHQAIAEETLAKILAARIRAFLSSARKTAFLLMD